MAEFKKGKKIRIDGGGELEILQKLGEGGQGIVYKVRYKGKELALKWYFKNKLGNKDKFYKNIRKNIDKGAPAENFLWPLEITEMEDDSFGYLMKLRPPEYQDFSKFMLAKVRFKNIAAVINAALQITTAFRALHSRGFSYQDLNDGNFFVNPKTGDVLICDNDNVAPYGENLGIAGKCRYMAPEVVIGKKMPDVHTDRFSLAVVLYLLLFLNHPLEGARTTSCPCLTEKYEKKYFGSEPIFVYDKENNNNRPVRGVHSNEIKLWPIYPTFVKDAFTQAFSQESMIGADQENRLMEKDWQLTFTKLRDILIACPHCHGETFYDSGSNSVKCLNCGKEISALPVMNVKKKYKIALTANKQIFACHTVYDSDDYKEITGSVIPSKNNPDVLGLKNKTSHDWEAINPVNGERKAIEPGKAFKIRKGLKIDFGHDNIGEIL